jgi:hypothetical protein
MKKMVFARIGGLSSHKYKVKKKVLVTLNESEDDVIEELSDEPSFHSPPVRKGVYAFIFPYIESFLWAWSDEHQREIKNGKGFRKFEYEGYLWCHLAHYVKDIHNREVSGSWVKVHTRELPELIRKCNHDDCKQLAKSGMGLPTNAYKKGPWGSMSKDHLEVFIEKV